MLPTRLYQAAISADAGFAMAWAGLGYLHYSFYVNRPELGEKEFRTALSLADRTTEREHAWIEMRYAESQGRVDDGLQLYRLFLQRFPGDWAAECDYARLLRMHGHAQQAVPMYQRLIRQQPDATAIWIELASAYGDLSQWNSAVQAYEKAFALDPSRMLIVNINQEYGGRSSIQEMTPKRRMSIRPCSGIRTIPVRPKVAGVARLLPRAIRVSAETADARDSQIT
ncbi:MAG: tetratricopeptide repeat protein [Acidobacteriaceae bacterium]